MTSPAFAVVLFGIGLAAIIYYVLSGEEETPHKNTDNRERDHRRSYSQRRSSCNTIEDMTQCSVCLSPITTPQRVRLCVSKHPFHEKCITKWEKTGPVDTCHLCPVCRRLL